MEFGYRSHFTQSWFTAVSQQCLLSRGKGWAVSQCHITPLARDGTPRSLEEFSSVTPFPYKPDSNPGEMVGLHRGRAPVCAKALGSHCTGWRKEQLTVGLWTTSQLLMSEGHSSTEVIPVGYFMQGVLLLKCQSVVSRMDHSSMPLVRHRVGSLGLFI